MKPDAWSREEMSRVRQEQLDGPNGAVAIRFASPEDTLLHKLVWFRLGTRCLIVSGQMSLESSGSKVNVLIANTSNVGRLRLALMIS
jgi:hypothetical protein